MLPDPSIVMAMQHTLAAPVAAIVRDVADVRGSLAQFRARNEKRLAIGNAEVSALVALGARLREDMWAAFRDHPVTEGNLQALDLAIESADTQCARHVRDFARLEKQYRRLLRKFRSVAPEFHQAASEISDRALGMMAREIGERVDFVNFLRALRAEHQPRAREGIIFSDPKELVRHLRAAMN